MGGGNLQRIGCRVGLVALLALSWLLLRIGSGQGSEITAIATPWSKAALPTARVNHIVDGRTFVVELDQSLRTIVLLGVDTPQMVNPLREAEYEERAREVLQRLLQGAWVKLELSATPANPTAAIPANVYRVSDHLLINYRMIRVGFAHAHTKTAYPLMRLFRDAESEARQEAVGLWGSKPPDKKEMGHGPALASRLPGNAVVYLTMADKRFHRDYCIKLRQTRYPVELQKARKAEYKPCSLCFDDGVK